MWKRGGEGGEGRRKWKVERRMEEGGREVSWLMTSQWKHHVTNTYHFLFSLLLLFAFLASGNKFHVGFLKHKV